MTVIPKDPYPCHCGNCNKDYDLSVQFALCPHELRAEGRGADSRPPFKRNFYPFYGHDDGLVVTQPESGKFVERPMTVAELEAREPARRIAVDIYRHANLAGVCYAELWHLIAEAIQSGIERSAEGKSEKQT